MRVIDPFYLEFFLAIIYKAIETRDRKDQLRVCDRTALAQGVWQWVVVAVGGGW